MKNYLLFLFILLVASQGMAQGLKGTYTIDPGKKPSATNYTSFNDAVSDLLNGTRFAGTVNGPGVTGPVVFNIVSHVYIERIEIDTVSGASATNTIVFRSAANDSTKVTLLDTISGGVTFAGGYVIYLNGAKYIHFDHITIRRTSSSNGNLIDPIEDDEIKLLNGADNNVFSNCRIIGNYSQSHLNSGYLVYSGAVNAMSYSVDEGNIFSNNYMSNSAGGVLLMGNGSSGQERGNAFLHNTIDSTYGAFTASDQDTLIVSGNKINMPTGGYGIYLLNIGSATSTRGNLISNNFVSVGNNPDAYGENYGLYCYWMYNTNVVYNNINIYGTTQTTFAAKIAAYNNKDNLNVYNNNFINLNSGYNSYCLAIYSISNEDYNNLLGGSYLVNGTYSNLAAWKKNTYGFGKHDVSIDPLYISNSNLHINNPDLNGTANPLSYIQTDIDSEARNTSTPDIGADEFTPQSIYPVVSAITSPSNGMCTGTHDVYITLNNFGSADLTSASLKWSINGVAQPDYSWTGTLAAITNKSVSSLTVKIGSYNFANAGSYVLTAIPDSANGNSFAYNPNSFYTKTISTGLKGTYTVDTSKAAKPDYTSLHAIANDLSQKGVCGAVLFSINDGVYNETLPFGIIAGASPANTITFQSKSLDSSKVIIDSAWGTDYYPTALRGYTMDFNGASYITFNKVTIINSFLDSSFPNQTDVIALENSANHISFNGCVMQEAASNYTSNGHCIYDEGNYEHHISVKNCALDGSVTSISLSGNSLAAERSNVIQNSVITGAVSIGIKSEWQDSFIVTGNNIYNCGSTGMLFNNGGITPKDTSRIINNFMSSMGINSGYALTVDDCPMLQLCFNTFANSSPSIETVQLYSSATKGSSLVYNNIFINYDNGLAINANSGEISKSDYNDFLTNGSVLASWNSTNCKDIAALRSQSKQDKHSLSVDPLLVAPAKGDLHLSSTSTAVTKKGIAIATIRTDIDGDRRASTPTIGADEQKIFLNDAGIVSLDSPVTVFCTASTDVYVHIYNFGTDTLKSLSINWTVNGIAMTGTSWTGVLLPGAGSSIKVGTLSLSGKSNSVVKIWSSLPNGVTDSNNINDTLVKTLANGLSGTYTIGGVSPDFNSFRSAVAALNHFGVCGPVIFNARDGSYNESLLIDSVAGASKTNTITFQSQSLDSNLVILDTLWPGSGVRGYTICFNNASYFTFRNMTISNYISSSWGAADVIDIINKTHDITLENNRMYCIPGSNISCPIIDYRTTTSTHYTIRNNIISGGNYGIQISGNSSSPELGNIIADNEIDSAVSAGIECTYQQGITISGNTVYLFSANYGINLSSGFGKDTSIIKNNFIIILGDAYGLYCYDIPLANIFNNSINISGSSSWACAGYFSGNQTGKVKVINNIFSNDYGGQAIYGDTYGISSSDYNDIFSGGGSTIGTWYLTSCSTLSKWQKASGFDKHSLSTDPKFYDAFNGDLHLTDSSLNLFSSGIHEADVITDIDGEKRKNIPDIGADEYSSDSNDVGIVSIVQPKSNYCGSDSTIVIVKLRNYGTKAQKNRYNIHVDVSGSASVSTAQIFKANLGPHRDTIIVVSFSPGLNTSRGGAYYFKAYTDLKNDSNHTNDTANSVINIYPAPNAVFSYVQNGAYTIDFTAKDNTLKTYTWNYGDKSIKDTGRKAMHTYAKSGVYYVNLAVITSNGCSNSWSDSVAVLMTGISDIVSDNSDNFNIYPNPFKGTTNISFTINENAPVSLHVYDLFGRNIATLVEGNLMSGSYTIPFNAEDYHCNSGVYVIKMTMGTKIITKEMNLVK